MRTLLDTHTFLWWAMDDPRMSSAAARILSDGANTLVLSAATAWEVVIKVQTGKLKVPDQPGRYVRRRMEDYGMESLPIALSHVLQVETLPMHHKDPFDRILIAQSLVENLPILTSDPILAKYGVEIIW